MGFPSPSNAADLTGIPTVIDGDTIEIHDIRIRLHGIDTPESAQLCTDPDGKKWRCGQKAALALSDHIDRRLITCRATGTDRYKRTIAVCYLEEEDLNAWLVRQGWALAYRRYSTDYVVQEEQAKAAALGIWSGDFIPPWQWRRERKRRAPAQE